ncbi:MAG: ectoine/hydroxyectoine ABC transporter substrate-binding protein EhuB [Thermodesulfobacteriota bacterium]
MSNPAGKKRTLLTITAVCAAVAAAIIMLVLSVIFQDTSLARHQQEGVIHIGYAPEAPYAFLTPAGEVTGESPEVARQITARLGIPHVVWRQSEFGALITELEAGLIDVIAAGMFITPERAERVNFSAPTFHVRQGLLVPKGNPRQLHSYRQAVTTADINLAALAGSVEEDMLLQLGLPGRRLTIVPDALTGRVAVETGFADGLALSAPTVQWMALQNLLGKTEMAHPFDHIQGEKSGYGAFAFRKEDRRLLAAWNEALQSYLGSPEHLALVARFGFTPAELPRPATPVEAPAR